MVSGERGEATRAISNYFTVLENTAAICSAQKTVSTAALTNMKLLIVISIPCSDVSNSVLLGNWQCSRLKYELSRKTLKPLEFSHLPLCMLVGVRRNGLLRLMNSSRFSLLWEHFIVAACKFICFGPVAGCWCANWTGGLEVYSVKITHSQIGPLNSTRFCPRVPHQMIILQLYYYSECRHSR